MHNEMRGHQTCCQRKTDEIQAQNTNKKCKKASIMRMEEPNKMISVLFNAILQ